MAKKYLTLNVGASNIELAEYEVGAKGAMTLVNYGTAALSASLDGGDAATILSPALLQIVREKGIRPGKVAISVAGQMVFPKFASIPLAGGGDKFEQMVLNEIEQGIPFPIDEIVCDRQILGDTVDGDKSVMIVAAKVDQVEALTSAVAAVGFEPEIVDVAPFALTNAVRHLAQGADECAVLLDIGAKTTSLVIVEGDKLYNRSIPVAGNTITKEIAQALGCSQEEAEQLKCERGYVSLGGVTEDDDEVSDRIAKVCRATMTRLNAEITRSINFYRSQQQGSAPTRLYLAGGSALLPQIDQFFCDSLQIEVVFFNPFERVKVGSKAKSGSLETDAALLGATVGLALHQAGLARFAVNLLPPSIISERAEKARLPFLAFGAACLVGALVLVMLGFNSRCAALESQRDEVQSVLDGLQGQDKAVKAANEKLAKEQAEAEGVRVLLARRSLAVSRLKAVRDSLVPGMWIEKWEPGLLTFRRWKKPEVAGVANVGDALKENLKKRDVIDSESVSLGKSPSIGKGQASQITVNLNFK